jgi:hypothetical protein
MPFGGKELTMYRAICGRCGRIMKIKKTGGNILEYLEDGCTEYRIFSADIYECPECHIPVACGMGNPIYPSSDDYEQLKKNLEFRFY